MKDEIKEILELFGSADENIMFCDIVELNSKQSHLLLDYITNLQEENEKLKELKYKFFDCSGDEEDFTLEDYLELGNKLYDSQEENNNLLRQIKIMKNYFELIINIGFDYDGYNKAKNLKSLIDELVKLASLGIKANDRETMYIDNQEKRYNILNEEIGKDI